MDTKRRGFLQTILGGIAGSTLPKQKEAVSNFNDTSDLGCIPHSGTLPTNLHATIPCSGVKPWSSGYNCVDNDYFLEMRKKGIQ